MPKNTPSFNHILKILKEGKQTKCVYCGYSFTSSPEAMRFATIEHLIPRGKTALKRGSNCENNTFLCCHKCNTVRRNIVPEGEFRNVLEKETKTIPSWLAETKNGGKSRYFISSPKMREKLIQKIRNEIIIPEHIKLYETWKEIFWKAEGCQERTELS